MILFLIPTIIIIAYNNLKIPISNNILTKSDNTTNRKKTTKLKS